MKTQILFYLILFSCIPVVFGQDQPIHEINLNLDKRTVSPDDTLLFVISSNFNSTAVLEVTFNDYTVFVQEFDNTSLGANYQWRVSGHSQNGTYLATVWKQDNPSVRTNSTFNVLREDVQLEIIEPFYNLYFNASFLSPTGKRVREWTANVTNLYTGDNIEDILVTDYYLLFPLDEQPFVYSRGNAIYIHAVSSRFEGEIYFSAKSLDIHHVSIDGEIKTSFRNYILGGVYVVATLTIGAIVIYKNRQYLVPRLGGEKRTLDRDEEDYIL